MRRRAEIKKAWYSMKVMLSMPSLTKKERRALKDAKDRFQAKLCEVDTDEAEPTNDILYRRELLHDNYDMKKLFAMLWGMLGRYTVDGVLSEMGYTRFAIIIQRALLGDDLTYDEAKQLARSDYISDRNCYGPLVEQAFNDILSEMVGLWAEISHIRFSASFTWSFFDRYP
jgi:hypothetical protein